MIVLAASDTLAAKASAASKVTSTVFGMTLNAGVETYGILDQRQLASSAATIYTVASSTQCFIKKIVVVNTDTVSRTFQYYRGGTAASNAITSLFNLGAGCMAVYEDAEGWTFFSSTGQLLTSAFRTVSPWPQLGPTDSIEESGRLYIDESTPLLMTSSRASMVAVYLRAGTLITSISFYLTGSWTSQTNLVFGILDMAKTLLAQTTDYGSGGPLNSVTLSLITPYRVKTAGMYYLAILPTALSCANLTCGVAVTDGTLQTGYSQYFGYISRGTVGAYAPAISYFHSQTLAVLSLNASQFFACIS